MDHGEERKAKGCGMAAPEFVTIWQEFFFYIFPREINEPTDSLGDYVMAASQSRCWNA